MPHRDYFRTWGPRFAAPLLFAILAAGCAHRAVVAKAPSARGAAASATMNPNVRMPVQFTAPAHVRGIYLTAWSAGSKRKMAAVYGLLSRTVLNSVVIDVRDSGEMYWKTGIPLAKAVHANDIAVPNATALMADLSDHHVYPIARIACFRDNFVPKAMPDRAVQTPDGKVWRDRSGHAWLDPYDVRNWDYVAQTVQYALRIGFPEIQLDYVRFPSEGKADTQRFPARKLYSNPNAKPEDVIADFCAYIAERVHAHSAILSADIFGIVSSTKGDEGIGQELEMVAKPFDVISPMVYPSHFAAGEYGIKAPAAAPYQILMKSLGDYRRRLKNKVVRPWLQDFTLGAKGQPTVKYGVAQIQAQIQAAHDCGYDDFLLWNAGNKYTEAAVRKLPYAVAGGSASPVTSAR